MQSPTDIQIRSESDIVLVRRAVRDLAVHGGFGNTDVTRIVTASSELARNLFKYAGQGVMHWRWIESADRKGLELEFVDSGPGIADVSVVMEAGYSSSGGLGMGLPGAKRLMDEMEIKSAPGKGTTVTVRKWQRR